MLLKELSLYFPILVVDEFLTSKMCAGCEKRMEASSRRGFFCKSCNEEVNRDQNAARNIEAVYKALAAGTPRPDYLSRRNNKGQKAQEVPTGASPTPTLAPSQATPGSPPLGVGPSTGAAAGVTPISGHSKKA